MGLLFINAGAILLRKSISLQQRITEQLRGKGQALEIISYEIVASEKFPENKLERDSLRPIRNFSG